MNGEAKRFIFNQLSNHEGSFHIAKGWLNLILAEFSEHKVFGTITGHVALAINMNPWNKQMMSTNLQRHLKLHKVAK